jgi:hypothetical protein
MANEVMGIDCKKRLPATPDGHETGMEDAVSGEGSRRRMAACHRMALNCFAGAILSAFLVGVAQHSCQAAAQENSLTREFTATERTASGLSEDQLTYSLSWDRWKENKGGTKRTEQGYKALVDPFKGVEMQSLEGV